VLKLAKKALPLDRAIVIAALLNSVQIGDEPQGSVFGHTVLADHVTIYRWVQRFTPLLAEAARGPAAMPSVLPAAWHRADRYGNNRVECDHGRLKARLRPMRGSSRLATPG
jgi:transposase-like protein